MKKLLTTIVSMLMAAVMVMFVGCGDKGGETGVIKGDYQDSDATAVSTALADVNTENLLGDKAADDYAAGLSIYLDFSTVEEYLDEKVSNSMSLDYTIGMTADSITGKGSMKADMPDELTGENNKYSATVYNDEAFIYMDAGESGKAKISLAYIMEMVMSMVGSGMGPGTIMSVEESGDEVGAETETAFDLVTMIAMLDEMGVKFAMDTSNNEIKIKMSFGEDVLSSLGGMTMSAEATETPESMYDTFVFDMYLHINADKQLVAFTANIDVAADAGDEGSMSMKAVMAIRVNNDTVTLPAGLAEDTTYIDISSMI